MLKKFIPGLLFLFLLLAFPSLAIAAGDDTTPPVTVATFTAATDPGYYAPVQATLTATDDLSGVLRTEFSLDRGITWTTYTKPVIFDADADDGFFYRSIDVAGNEEGFRAEYVKDGLTPDTAFMYHPRWPQGPEVKKRTATSTGTTYFRMDGLLDRRQFRMKVSGATSIIFEDIPGQHGSSTCIPASDPKECLFEPYPGGTWYATVTSDPGAPLLLTSADGSDQSRAYWAPDPFRSSGTEFANVPAGGESWTKVNVNAGTFYGLSIPNAQTITLYDQYQTVIDKPATANWINFTAQYTGTYWIKMTAPTTAETNYWLDWYPEGEAIQTAFAYTYKPPVPQTHQATASGVTWFKVDGLQAARTFEMTVMGATDVGFTDSTGTGGATCSSSNPAVCRFEPATNGTWWANVSSPENQTLTLTSADGSVPEQAYTVPDPFTYSHTYRVPPNGESWTKVTLTADTPYGLRVTGATSIAIYQDTTQLTAADADWVNFKPGVTGTYFVKVKGSPTAYTDYRLEWYPAGDGNTLQTAYVLPTPGPASFQASANGTTWFKLEGLEGSRVFELKADGATSISFTDSTGYGGATCTTASNPKDCWFSPATSGTWWAKVSSSGNAMLTLTAADGKDQSRAYGVPAPFTASPTYRVPANGDSWTKVTLTANTVYGLQVLGATSLAIYQDATQVAAAQGTWLTYTPGGTGTYYVKARGSATAYTDYRLTWYAQGEAQQTAFPYVHPGPQSGKITSKGYTWYRVDNLIGGHAFSLTIAGATGISFYTASGSGLGSTCNTLTPKTCTFTPSTSGTYYFKVTGTAGSTITLSSTIAYAGNVALEPFSVRDRRRS